MQFKGLENHGPALNPEWAHQTSGNLWLADSKPVTCSDQYFSRGCWWFTPLPLTWQKAGSSERLTCPPSFWGAELDDCVSSCRRRTDEKQSWQLRSSCCAQSSTCLMSLLSVQVDLTFRGSWFPPLSSHVHNKHDATFCSLWFEEVVSSADIIYDLCFMLFCTPVLLLVGNHASFIPVIDVKVLEWVTCSLNVCSIKWHA